MSEGETLFAVLCLLYLSDCLVWMGKRTVLFSSPWHRRWRVSFGNPYLGNLRGGLVFLNPLPPLGEAFLAHWHPISFSPQGVCALNLQTVGDSGRPSTEGGALAYGDITEAGSDGKWLLLNGTRFARCATPEQAEDLARFVGRVARERPERQEEAIREFFDRRFDKQEALRRLREVRGLLPHVRRICVGFFVCLYLIAPVTAVAFGLSRVVIPVAIIMLGTGVLISLRFARAHRIIHPLRKGDRLAHIVKMVFCPPVAIRAADFLTLDALDGFHPILLSRLFLGPEGSAFLRAVVSDLKHPLRHGQADRQAIAIAQWHARACLDACARLLETEGSAKLDDLLRPPPWDGASEAYCPRCFCQFTRRSGECPDCPGVRLLPLTPAPAAAAGPE